MPGCLPLSFSSALSSWQVVFGEFPTQVMPLLAAEDWSLAPDCDPKIQPSQDSWMWDLRGSSHQSGEKDPSALETNC